MTEPKTILTRDEFDAPPQTPEEFQKHAVAFIQMAAECLHPQHGYAELTRDMARALVPLLVPRAAAHVSLSDEQTSFLRAFMGEDEGEAPSPIRLQVGERPDGYGLYVSLAEQPQEGSSLLVPLARSPEPAPISDARQLELWGDRSEGPPNRQIVSYGRAVLAEKGKPHD